MDALRAIREVIVWDNPMYRSDEAARAVANLRAMILKDIDAAIADRAARQPDGEPGE